MNLSFLKRNLHFVLVVCVAVLLINLLSSSTRTVRPTNNEELASTSVMITNLEGNSGGSGVILDSSANKSTVLTNGHVCRVVENGGIVQSNTRKSFVSSFKRSHLHDLCIITVNSDLDISTVVSKRPEKLFSNINIVGHPGLSPVLITRGNISEKVVVSVMMGMRPCTEEEAQSPDLSFICGFLGALPVVRTYEAQYSAATIMPGSSGSPVFNDKGYIVGLVFAGKGELGYSLLVPVEYINYFLDEELELLMEEYPNTAPNEFADQRKKIKSACENRDQRIDKKYCELVDMDLLF